MRAKFIKESVLNILQPKPEEEIEKSLSPHIKKLINEAYDIIQNNSFFEIVTPLGFFSLEGVPGYGFQFETRIAITDEEIIRKWTKQSGEISGIPWFPTNREIAEFTFGYFPEEKGIYLIFENSGLDIIIYNLEEFKMYIDMYDMSEFMPESLENIVNESITDILKPKSEEELKSQFEKDHPVFVEIFKNIFPNEEYTLQPEEEGIEANFMFKEGDEMFMVSQNKFHEYPNIFYLDRDVGGERFAGIFTNQRPVKSVEDVHEYVRKTLNPIYDRR